MRIIHYIYKSVWERKKLVLLSFLVSTSSNAVSLYISIILFFSQSLSVRKMYTNYFYILTIVCFIEKCVKAQTNTIIFDGTTTANTMAPSMY